MPPRATISPLLVRFVALLAVIPLWPTIVPALVNACAAERVTPAVWLRTEAAPAMFTVPALLEMPTAPCALVSPPSVTPFAP